MADVLLIKVSMIINSYLCYLQIYFNLSIYYYFIVKINQFALKFYYLLFFYENKIFWLN